MVETPNSIENGSIKTIYSKVSDFRVNYKNQNYLQKVVRID